MPLSEDEQRILSEIEQQLYETDPDLAKNVAQTTIYTHALRNMKWAGVLFVAGVAAMVVTLSISFLLAFGGFLVMLGAALWFERNARRMGRAGIAHATGALRNQGLRDILGSPGKRLRDRFPRERPSE